MKKCVCAWMILVLLFSSCGQAMAAKVYYNQTPPKDWNKRKLMRLTVFGTILNDAMLLQCGGRSMIIDGGLRKYGGKLLKAYRAMGLVDKKGNVYVDRIFNTHPHADHLQGIIYMVENGLRTGMYLTSFSKKEKDELHQKALALMRKKKIRVHLLRQRELFSLGGAKIRVFWNKYGRDLNHLSAILHITYGDATLLLPADIGPVTMKSIVNQVPASYLQADVMKMPHHGYNICDASFLDAVHPQFVFATNRKKAVRDVAYQMRCRKIRFTTNDQGRIVLETDGKVWYITQLRFQF